MTKAEYIQRVLAILNETSFEGMTDVFGADTVKVERFIEGVYVDAWKRSTAMLPASEFAQAVFTGIDEEGNDTGTLHPNIGQGTGYVELPADYWMLGKFKMAGWRRPVYQAFGEDDHIASVQANEYTRGNFERPVCILSTNEKGKILEYYSLPRGVEHTIESALYVPVALPIEALADDAVLNLSEKVQFVLVYNAAVMVLTYFEKTDAAKAVSTLLEGFITQ
jgi:hypothetical protein